jgi:hypothetical protein
MNERLQILLEAALELLQANADSIEGTVFYDDTDCDVYCLIDDIEAEIG